MGRSFLFYAKLFGPLPKVINEDYYKSLTNFEKRTLQLREILPIILNLLPIMILPICFSQTVQLPNRLSLDKQLNIIQVADLVLPDAETTFEEYTTMELLSVSMLIVISTFALDFIHSNREIFKIVDLDEAWSFLQVAQGKTLSNKLVRAGRAMNAGVYFVTQNSDDLLDERLKNNIGLKFAFRSTDIHEIKKTLEFFGLDQEDESNQNACEIWKTVNA